MTRDEIIKWISGELEQANRAAGLALETDTDTGNPRVRRQMLFLSATSRYVALSQVLDMLVERNEEDITP